jgi:hypothetical protein
MPSIGVACGQHVIGISYGVSVMQRKVLTGIGYFASILA